MTAGDTPEREAPEHAERPESGAPRRGVSRRGLLLGGAVGVFGAAAAIGTDLALSGTGAAPAGAGSGEPGTPGSAPGAEPALHGTRTVPFYGARQAGVETPPQAHSSFIALDLRPEVDRAALIRLMRILTDDAARLTQGRPALADQEPELAGEPSSLTVTFGFGPGVVALAPERPSPEWVRPLPAFGIDRLDPAYGDGDLLLQVCADDPFTLAHAVRMLLKDSRTFATVRWQQRGFRRAVGAVAHGTTMRNLFGQVDGTVNPAPGTPDFAGVVWIDDPGSWMHDGTGFVLRRIRMDVDTWDRLDRDGREQSVGRRLDSGAPLTGTREHDEPDFEAKSPLGFPVIAEFSHMRRSRLADTSQRIYRRAYNYDDAAVDESVSNTGLLFASYQADVDHQFVPIQRALDELDLLNEWTTPVGSAVFALPPGCAEGGYIGETLLG